MTIPPVRIAPEITNLLPNPRFESGGTAWARSGVTAPVQDTDVTLDGVPSGRVVVTSVDSGPYITHTDITAQPGDTHVLSMFIRADQPGRRARIRVYDMPGFLAIASTTYVDLADDDWTQLAIAVPSAVAGTTSRQVIAQFDQETAEVDDTFWIVQPMFNPGTTAAPYRDGTMAGCDWTGSDNASPTLCPARFSSGSIHLGNTHVAPLTPH